MPLTSRNTKHSRKRTVTTSNNKDNKFRKRKVVTSADKQGKHTHQILQTKSESALPVRQSESALPARQSRKKVTKKKVKDEQVTQFKSKKLESKELHKKLSAYEKMLGKLEIPVENLNIRENIRNLLLNKKNEIDIERIMALHLLSLRPARKCYRLQFTEARSDEEDEDDRQLTRYSETLPHYIIVSEDFNHCDCFRDKNRKIIKSTYTHLSINRQVEELLNAAIEAIRNSNPSKLEKLWLQAYDTNNVKKLLNKEKFRYLLTSMKYNLKWLLSDNADMKTEMCELRDVTFYRVNKYRDYQANTVFKLSLPEMIYQEIMFDDRINYYLRIADISLRLVKGQKYLLPEEGLCVFQNPPKPAGIIILAENGQFISLINGPEFNTDGNIDIKFHDIALYVLFYFGIKDHTNEWEDVLKTLNKTKRMDNGEIEENDSDDKLDEATRKSIMKKVMKSLGKEEKLIYSSKYAIARRHAKLNDENVTVKFAQILKEVISINRIMRTLSEFTIKERELAMKSSNYGGLGLARIIIGKNTMQLIKNMCSEGVTQLQVTPMHNTNVLDTELRKVSLNIYENIDDIRQELYNFEHSKVNKFLLTEFETNKIKQFDF